jgi:hypothetical protein
MSFKLQSLIDIIVSLKVENQSLKKELKEIKKVCKKKYNMVHDILLEDEDEDVIIIFQDEDVLILNEEDLELANNE